MPFTKPRRVLNPASLGLPKQIDGLVTTCVVREEAVLTSGLLLYRLSFSERKVKHAQYTAIALPRPALPRYAPPMLARRHPLSPLIARAKRLNWWFAGLVGILCAIGLAMMFSVGGGGLEFALPQGVRLLIAFALMFAVSVTPMHYLLRYAYVFYALGLLALLVVEVVGHIGMGAQRWIHVGGLTLQPSELMKIAVILALARYFHLLRPEDVKRPLTLIPPVLLLLIPAALILKQPNLGTATITLAVGGAMLLLAGVQWRYFIAVALSAVAAAPVAWHFLHDYQRRRVLTFLDPQADPLGAGYNILQSMIAVGSGGLTGKGYLNGSQSQLNFLPEKHTDFIFTVLAEEWGFLGGCALLALYGLLLLYAMNLAIDSRSRFGALVAGGVAALVFAHVFINVAMVMGMIPVVGVPLPFLSYGGSILFSTLLAMGLLLNVDLHRDKQPMAGGGWR